MATSSTSTTKSSKGKGYRVSDVKYEVYNIGFADGWTLADLGTSGSPSEMWSRLRAHLECDKHHAVSDLKLRGYRVRAVEAKPELRPEPSAQRPHFVDKIANEDFLTGDSESTPFYKSGWFYSGVIGGCLLMGAVIWYFN